MGHDIVIRNGRVVDGSGSPPFGADIAISDGHIAAIGRVTERGATDIDAEGHIVTPGFIDGHTHMDAQVMWDPLGTSSCWHGVTTVVMGNCGFTLAPVLADRHDLVVRNLERAEDISAAAMAAGITWTWQTYPEFLDAVEALPKGINYAGYVGHAALRTWAMGERAFQDEAASDDLVAMRQQLQDALIAGAMGFSTSRSDAHMTSDDRPVASRAASWAEVCELVETVGKSGGGIFELALEPAYDSPDPAERAEFLGRLQKLTVKSGVRTMFGVIATPQNVWRDLLKCIETTNAAGGRMTGQSHSRPISVILSFQTRLPFDVLPEWQELRAKPLDQQRAALRDPETRARLIAAAEHGAYRRATGVEAPKPDYDSMRVLERPIPPNPTVSEVARARGVSPAEAMIDLALESDFRQLFMQEIHNKNPDDILTIMRHPNTVMTFSDSGAHVSQIMDSSIQTHLLAYWVRECEEISLATAVNMLTQVPAQAWGFESRGLLREGFAADVNVIDPVRVAPELPTVETDLPAHAKRLKQRSTGFLATIVNGEVVLRAGEHTGAFPGRLLRRGLHATP